jgi:hypothetical protein
LKQTSGSIKRNLMASLIELKGAYIQGEQIVKGKKVALAHCEDPGRCSRTLSFLSREGDQENIRLTVNWFGIPTKNDPFRCILFTQEGSPHPDPGKQWVNEAAVCGMTFSLTG